MIDRRRFLRGAGTVLVGLPVFEEVLARPVWAAEPDPPERLITVFFGLGLPPAVAAEGFAGPLRPLAPFADKLGIVRNLTCREAETPANNHLDGGGCAFVGHRPITPDRAGGPSIDQVARRALYPNDVPTPIKTLPIGTWFRRSNLTRYVHCWNADGSPADLPVETPAALFERVFGGDTSVDPERRYRRSVLDSVLGQYRSLSGPSSPLGGASKAKLADHLDRIRELERRIFPPDEPMSGCTPPGHPGELPLLRGQPTGGTGPDVDVAEWQVYWRAMVDLYVLALQCDLFRFGNVMFQSAGDRVKLQGPYDYLGETVATFADQIAHHEYWHAYQAANENLQMRAHAHFIMDQVAYVLSRLDDPSFLEPNGRTLLDNTMVVLGTEVGNGAVHDYDGVLHMYSSANERMRVGQIVDPVATGVDFYRTVLSAIGVDEPVGDSAFANGPITALRP